MDERHPCHHSNIALKATHAGRVQTNTPIVGVMTQPYTSDPENADQFGSFSDVAAADALKSTFILMDHVKFL